MIVPLGEHRLILVSGQIAADSSGQPLAPGNLGEQARIVFANLESVLTAAGASLRHLVKVQIFLTDMSQWPQVAAVRNELLGDVAPVSTVLEIGRTVIVGCDLEIEALAIGPIEAKET
jgi:enamine deaminase RidA (YjgF/YER057c/UK114 family)